MTARDSPQISARKKGSDGPDKVTLHVLKRVSQWLSGKESTCQAGDVSSIPGSGRSPGEGNCNPLQYSCLGNPMDRGVW